MKCQDFSLAHHTNRSPKIKVMVTKSQQNTTLITSLTSRVWCTMSFSVSDRSVFCFFHNNFEASEIPFKRNMEKTGSCTILMCPFTGSLQSGGSFSKEPNSNHPPATTVSRCCSMRLLAHCENEDRAQKSSCFVCRRNATECNCRPHSHTKTGFPEGLTTMVRPQEQCFCAEEQYLTGEQIRF